MSGFEERGPDRPVTADEVRGILAGYEHEYQRIDNLERREKALTLAIVGMVAELDRWAAKADRPMDLSRRLAFSQAAQLVRDRAEEINRETPRV